MIRSPFLLLAATLALPALAAAQIRYEPGQLIASEGPAAIASGDFDGDGRRDIAVLDGGKRLTLHLQASVGEFTAMPLAMGLFDTAPHDAPLAVAAGDFNEDGRDDMVFPAPGGWRMLLSQPDGSWVLRKPPANEHVGAAAPLVYDINRDGHLDLVQAQQLYAIDGNQQRIGSALHLYFGDGQGNLHARGVLPAGVDAFRGVVAGHFNADPFVDIATIEGGAYLGEPFHLVIRHGFGGSAFAAATRIPDQNGSLAAGDFNGDGRDDLVTGAVGGVTGAQLYQFLQLPSGMLDQPRPLAAGGWMRALRQLDGNGDGRDDLVGFFDNVPGNLDRAWLLSWDQHDGQLRRPEVTGITQSHGAGPDDASLATGDFDGDGGDDVAERVAGGIQLHLARPHVPSGPGARPTAPTITGIQSEEGDRSATVTVARPASDGGSPILGYRVLTTPAGPLIPPVVPLEGSGSFTFLLTDLPIGKPFQVQVQAFNAVGDGPASAAVPVTLVPLRELRIDEYVYLPEGDEGPVVHHVPARLNWPAGPGGVRFDVSSSSTSAGQAQPGVHYEAVSLEGVFIPEGETETTIPVTIIGNTEPDTNRHFTLRVENVTGAAGSGLISWVRIQTEEFAPGLPLLYGLSGEVVEGDEGQQLVPVRLAFDRPLEGDVVVGVLTDDRPNTTPLALPPQDYDATPIPDFTVPAGASEATIHIPVNGDTTPEPDEFMMILFYVVSGPAGIAPNGGNYAVTLIWDDDRTDPPLHARADRIVLSQNGTARFSLVSNDVFVEERTRAPITDYTEVAVGELHYRTNASQAVGDDEMVFRAAPGFVGVHRQPYYLCEYPEYSRRCAVAELELVVRPLPEEDLRFEVAAGSGHRDIAIQGLMAMPGARFEASPLVQPLKRDIVLARDPDALSPWDEETGTAVSVHTLPRPSDEQPRQWRVLVDAHALEAGDVDLYLGVDTDRDGRADPGELLCTSARVPSGESCELDIAQPGDAAVSYWVMLHNRSEGSLQARAEIAAVRLDAGSDGSLVATGPGRLQAGEHFTMRLAWNGATMLPGERRVGYVHVRADAQDAGGLVPVRLTREEDADNQAALALVNGRPRSLALAGGDMHRHLFVDVPEGASSLAVQTRSGQAVDLYLVPAGAGSAPRIDAAPANTSAAASSVRAGGDEDAVVYMPAPGRWYAVVENTGTTAAQVDVTATIMANPPEVRPGSYFDPERGGHGLVIYPAGSQWVGLWYTYFQDGSPTWLYLQGPAPGEDGLWTAPIYRTAWNGSAQHVVQVGEATATPTGADAFRFTWTLDGETGSEPMASLGRGCPTLAGAPLDASSHWFDAVRAGTGYSVQLWNNYEMHLAFVYDTQGLPRFLIAEGPGFGGAERSLDLEQLQGFCPLCDRPAAPGRRTVGTFLRRFASGTMQVDIDGLYAPSVPGLWSANDDARPLGGPGTTQGCAP